MHYLHKLNGQASGLFIVSVSQSRGVVVLAYVPLWPRFDFISDTSTILLNLYQSWQEALSQEQQETMVSKTEVVSSPQRKGRKHQIWSQTDKPDRLDYSLTPDSYTTGAALALRSLPVKPY